MLLVFPAEGHLDSYADALRRGWSPNTEREDAAREQLQRIALDPIGFLASLVDREAKGDPIRLPDGTEVPRLPGYVRWMWDGEFCGNIGLRWQPGSADLPEYCLGHIGYSVVPWKRRRGYATQALRLMRADARAQGLPYVDLTTDTDNAPSRRVIEANGGVLVGRFTKPAAYGSTPGLRFRITLPR